MFSVSLGFLSGGNPSSYAFDLSADGSTVVGRGRSVDGDIEAFRYTDDTGMLGIGHLPGGSYSDAYGVSADGAAVVGFANSSNTTSGLGWEAFLWTKSGGIQGLGDLAGGRFWSDARSVSADGSTVVGFGYSISGREAFRWTSAGGMVGLGDLPGGGL